MAALPCDWPIQELIQTDVAKVVRHEGDKWNLYTRDGSKKLGEFDTEEQAKKRERQIQYFKHRGQVGKASSGVMVAFFLKASEATRLTIQDGEAPEELHITVLYLGQDLEAKQIETLNVVVGALATKYAPLQGTLAGLARFPATNSSDGKDVLVRLIDVPRLEALREQLISACRQVGIEPVLNHGYTPHVTLAYVDPTYEGESLHVDEIPFSLDGLTLAAGPDRKFYPMSGEDVLKQQFGDWPVVEKFNPYHEATSGRFGSRGAASSAGRSERASSTYKPSTAAKQQLADKSERHLASALGAQRTPDNSAFDLIKGKAGIEVKTLIDNRNSKITMHPSSRLRKLREARRSKLSSHTVVIDRRGARPEYYYARGVGSFRLQNMQKLTGLNELRTVLP